MQDGASATTQAACRGGAHATAPCTERTGLRLKRTVEVEFMHTATGFRAQPEGRTRKSQRKMSQPNPRHM
eukprot:3639094-Prymnesium_polylepis.1